MDCDVTKDVSNPVTNVATAAGVIDWDGDGAYDLLLPTAGHIYHNDGNGKLLKDDAIPTARNQAVAFPDWDGDGLKDYLVNGVYDTDYLSSAQRGKVAIVSLSYSPCPPLGPPSRSEGKKTWMAASVCPGLRLHLQSQPIPTKSI